MKSEPAEVDLTPHLVVPVKPEQDDLLLTPQQASSVEEFTFGTESSENVTSFTPRKLSTSKKALDSFESTCSTSSCIGAPSEYFTRSPPVCFCGMNPFSSHGFMSYVLFVTVLQFCS